MYIVWSRATKLLPRCSFCAHANTRDTMKGGKKEVITVNNDTSAASRARHSCSPLPQCSPLPPRRQPAAGPDDPLRARTNA